MGDNLTGNDVVDTANLGFSNTDVSRFVSTLQKYGITPPAGDED